MDKGELSANDADGASFCRRQRGRLQPEIEPRLDGRGEPGLDDLQAEARRVGHAGEAVLDGVAVRDQHVVVQRSLSAR